VVEFYDDTLDRTNRTAVTTRPGRREYTINPLDQLKRGHHPGGRQVD